jgi:hypothetical protein
VRVLDLQQRIETENIIEESIAENIMMSFDHTIESNCEASHPFVIVVIPDVIWRI